MKARELRALARESLKNKWGKGAILTLFYLIINWGISYMLGIIPIIGQIAYIVISPVLNFGILISFIKLSKDENPTNLEFFNNGFALFGKLWGIIFHTFLKLLFPIFIVIAGVIMLSIGIVSSSASSLSDFAIIGAITYLTGLIYIVIKTYSYSLTSFILNDEPTLTAKEIVNKSETLMEGNKWRYFYLSLSFIGWILLSTFTFGIGYLLILPYIDITSLKFYEELVNSNYSSTETDYDNLA